MNRLPLVMLAALACAPSFSVGVDFARERLTSPLPRTPQPYGDTIRGDQLVAMRRKNARRRRR